MAIKILHLPSSSCNTQMKRTQPLKYFANARLFPITTQKPKSKIHSK